MKTIPFSNSDEFNQLQAEYMAETAAKAISSGEAPVMMISGGSTPKKTYEILAQDPSSLSGPVQLILSDDRYVPKSDPKSNTGWITPLLLKAGLSPDAWFDIDTDKEESVATNEFIEALNRLTQKPSIVFDTAFLGIGADGHTCGLFDYESAEREDVPALAMDRADGLRGISVTRAILMKFKRIVVTAQGEDKRCALHCLQFEPDQIIAGHALQGHPHVEIWANPSALGGS